MRNVSRYTHADTAQTAKSSMTQTQHAYLASQPASPSLPPLLLQRPPRLRVAAQPVDSECWLRLNRKKATQHSTKHTAQQQDKGERTCLGWVCGNSATCSTVSLHPLGDFAGCSFVCVLFACINRQNTKVTQHKRALRSGATCLLLALPPPDTVSPIPLDSTHNTKTHLDGQICQHSVHDCRQAGCDCILRKRALLAANQRLDSRKRQSGELLDVCRC